MDVKGSKRAKCTKSWDAARIREIKGKSRVKIIAWNRTAIELTEKIIENQLN